MKPIVIYVKEGETIIPKLESGSDCSTSDGSSISESEHQSHLIGACPLCHRFLMLLSLKKHLIGEEQFDFIVTRVNINKPPIEFQQKCFRTVPAIVDYNHSSNPFSSTDEIEMFEHLNQMYPTPALNEKCSEEEFFQVEKLTSDLFRKFNIFIKDVSKNSAPFLSAIRSLNERLENKGWWSVYFAQPLSQKFYFFLGYQFLFGNTINNLDTLLMPKLHQIRVASSYMRSVDIPGECAGIWRYLHRAYQCPAFVAWCPTDQEIILNWTAKAGSKTPELKLSFEEKKKLTKSEPQFSISVPCSKLN